MLKVVVMLDSLSAPRWIQETLARLAENEAVEVVAAVIPSNEVPSKGRFVRLLQHAVFYLFRMLDEKLFKKGSDNPFEPAFIDLPCIEVAPRRTRFSDFIEGEELEKVKQLNADLILRFGFRILRGPILDLTRFGVWSLHHGDERYNRGAPAGYWEFVHQERSVSATLQILSSELDGGQVIAKVKCPVDPLSWYRTKRELYWNSVDLIEDEVRNISLPVPYPKPDPFFRIYDRALYKPPTNLPASKHLWQYCWRLLKTALTKSLSSGQWRLLVGPTSKTGVSLVLSRLKQLVPPPDRFWADPFIIQHDDHWVIFAEELMFDTNRGRIITLKVDAKGKLLDEPVVAIEEDYHLSYPQIVEVSGEKYLVLESCENRTIDLYRCLSFPNHWQKHRVLMDDLIAVDPTIFFHNDRWWMFINTANTPYTKKYTRLNLYYTDDPIDGDWIAHPQNPILRDASKARPAGPVFPDQDGNLIRPSQDCTGGYGRALNFNRIKVINPDYYSEELIEVVEPYLQERMEGIHTYGHHNGMAVTDGLWRVSKA